MQIRALLTSTIVAGGLVGAPAQAADFGPPIYDDPEPIASYDASTGLPAVSGLNGKVGVLGGWKDDDFFDDGVFGLQGSLSGPISHSFGFQIDGIIGAMDGDFMAGVGGHLFWRDPSVGLFGVYGSFTHFDAVDVTTGRLGLEGAFYYGNVTLEGTIGWENVDLPSPLGDDDNLYVASRLAYYFMPDFQAYIGYRHESDISMGVVGFEYQMAMASFPGFSVFGEGRIGEDDFTSVWFGVRKYFGQDKSLIRRHREDDPVHWLWIGGGTALANACHDYFKKYFDTYDSPSSKQVASVSDYGDYSSEEVFKSLKSVCPSSTYKDYYDYYNPYDTQS